MQVTRIWSLSGKIPYRRKWQPTPVFLPREFHGQRSLVSHRPRGRKESDTTEELSTCTHVLRRAEETHWADILETLSVICSQNQPDQEAPSPEPGCLCLRPTESTRAPCVLPLSSWSCLANSGSRWFLFFFSCWFHLSVCVCVCMCVCMCFVAESKSNIYIPVEIEAKKVKIWLLQLKISSQSEMSSKYGGMFIGFWLGSWLPIRWVSQKVHSGFSVRWYGKIWTNALAIKY